MKETSKPYPRTNLMWPLTFLVIALLAALLGFGGIAGTTAAVARVLAGLFLAVFLASLLVGRRLT